MRRLPFRMFVVSEPEQGGREASDGRVCGWEAGGQRLMPHLAVLVGELTGLVGELAGARAALVAG
jgi:hypothetical protein